MRKDARERIPSDHKGVAGESGQNIVTMCLDCGRDVSSRRQAPNVLVTDLGERQNRKAVTEVRTS